MKEPMKYTISLDDDYEQLDNIVRLRLIQVIEDMELYDDNPELLEAMLKVLASFSTPSQWQLYKASKGVSDDA